MPLSPAVRISLGLVCLTVAVLLLAKWLGLAPDEARAYFESRRLLAEKMAVQLSVAAEGDDLDLIRRMLQNAISRDPDIRSAAVRGITGELLAQAGNHPASWQLPSAGQPTPFLLQVPVFRAAERWATAEVSFAPSPAVHTLFGIVHSCLGLTLFVSLAGFAGYYLFIKMTLRELDPVNVIPERVQAAFNVLKEGVLILDEEEQIVLANSSFEEMAGKSSRQLIGLRGSELDWLGYLNGHNRRNLPWLQVMAEGTSRIGVRMILENGQGPPVKLVVNAAPVLDERGGRRGILVTFDNVTELEEKNLELNQTVRQLQVVTAEVQSKNRELEFLASHDPLTQLLNRRALNEGLEREFSEARRQGRELSCIMCDIDHFKWVNDNRGHAAGDQVITRVAALLQQNSRESDLVGRWGGEEFCILLPGLDIGQAAGMAGRIGAAVGEEETAGVKVTLSFGVSSLRAEVREPGELINRADSALYIAKEGGRNRVVCWDDDEMRCLAAKAGRKAKAGDEPGNVPAAGEPPEARHYRETMLTVRLQAAETTPEKSRPAQKSKDCLLSV